MKHLRVGRYGGVDVVTYVTAPHGSVLAGQTLTRFLNNYPNEAAARRAHPDAVHYVNKWSAPQVSLNHLPDNEG